MQNEIDYGIELNKIIYKRQGDHNLSDMISYYQQMKQAGYAVKNEYPLAPIGVLKSNNGVHSHQTQDNEKS